MGRATWQPPDVVASGRIGVRLTVALLALVVLDLVIRQVVPGTVAVVALAVVAVMGVAGRRIDWDRITELPVGSWAQYAWTSAGLVAWAAYVGAVGDPAPDQMILILAVAVIASAVGFPIAGQVAMYAVAIGSLIAGRLLAGSPMLATTLVLEVGLLLVLALVAATVSLHLREARRTAGWMRAAAERRSDLIHAVASLSRLDPQEAMEAAVSALVELGFDAAAISELEDGVLRPRAHRGFPSSNPPSELRGDRGVASRALTEAQTVVVEDYPSDPAALDRRPDVGSVVAAPIVVDGIPSGAVIGARRTKGHIPPLQVEVIETLAAQAGRVIANARRYAAEHETGRRLADLNHMKSELLASVSAELRAPLTVVRGVSETLKARPELLDSDDELLRRLNANADRLADMIHDLLDFSRLQAGRYELDAVPVDLALLVRDAAHPSVRVQTVGSVIALADERLLRRALGHLLAGGERVYVPTDVTIDGAGEGDKVTVEIRMRRDQHRSSGGAIGVSLASEILASHEARLELDDSGPDVMAVRFALDAPGVAEVAR